MAFLRGIEESSGRQTQLPRAESWGQDSALISLRRPGSNHFPEPGTHLCPGFPPAPQGAQLLPLSGPGRCIPAQAAPQTRLHLPHFAGHPALTAGKGSSLSKDPPTGPSQQVALPQAGPTVFLQRSSLCAPGREAWGSC